MNLKRKKRNICGLCCKTSTNFETINDVTKEIMEVLRLKMNSAQRKESVICKICTEKLHEFFEFKSKCLYTEDYIAPFLKPENNGVLDIEIVYMDVINGDGKKFNIPNAYRICRLCMGPVEDGSYICLVDLGGAEILEMNILQQYFPEICLNSIKAPIICKLCQETLQKYYNFAMDNLDVNTNNQQSQSTSISFQDNAATTQEDSPKKAQYEYAREFILHRSVHKRNARSSSKCDMCSYQTSDKNELKTHIATHKDGVMFRCDQCPYRVRHRALFTRHLLVHRNPKDMPLFKCVKCMYATNRKDSLRNHMLTHKKSSERMSSQCPICSKTIVYKRKMNRHLLTHKAAAGEEVPMHKCPRCLYQSVRLDTLKRHMLSHEKDSDVTFYKCQQCTYETKLKSSLKTHMLKHKKRSEVVMYRCEQCEYQTKYKAGLRNHLVTHKTLKDVPTFKCFNCSYETKVKKSLETHMNVHKSEVTLHKCKMCSFDTRYLSTMKQHVINRHYDELYA